WRGFPPPHKNSARGSLARPEPTKARAESPPPRPENPRRAQILPRSRRAARPLLLRSLRQLARALGQFLRLHGPLPDRNHLRKRDARHRGLGAHARARRPRVPRNRRRGLAEENRSFGHLPRPL